MLKVKNTVVTPKNSTSLMDFLKKCLVRSVAVVERIYSIGLLYIGCIFGWMGLFVLPFDWFYIKAVFAWYVFSMFGVMIGYHRYFAHRSFKTSRAFQFFLGLCSACTLMGGPMWWASRHRRHHKHCGTENDVHCLELRGFWYAHIGWIVMDDFKTDWDRVRDFDRFPELRILDGVVAYLYIVQFAVMFYIDKWLPLWILTLGMFITYNIVFAVNSIAHMSGTAPFKAEFCPEECRARNVAWLAYISFGEGWHNNHHSDMGRANAGFINSPWEMDLAFLIIVAMEYMGIVWDVNSCVLPVRTTAMVKEAAVVSAIESKKPLSSAEDSAASDSVSTSVSREQSVVPSRQ